MSALKNPKHEMFAMARFNGMGINEAYAAAGYRPHRGNASRMSDNENILRRIAELQAAKVQKIIHYDTIDVLEQAHKLIDLVKDAAEAGDYTNAIKGQSFLLRIFGFEDSPTLAHDMLGSRKVKHHEPPAAGTRAPARANSNALSGALEQLKKARAKFQ